VTAHTPKKHVSLGLALVCLMLLLGLMFRPQAALGLVSAGNQFFGGHLPYNLVVADGLYVTALALDSNVPDAWHQRARIAFLHGDFDVALKRINTQIALHGDSFMASYYIRGLIYGYARNFPAAEEDFTHFLTWDRYNWAANNDLAWIYFKQGKYNEVVQRIHGLATTAKPPNPWLLTMDAMSLYNLGDTQTAHKELLEARAAAALLTQADWVHAYPGNDPGIAAAGLASFRSAIEENLVLVENNLEGY
jgi:tetratricopeptide (TPR) repeat protein